MPSSSDADALVQLLYGAAAEPSLWQSALDTFGDAIGGGVLVISRQTVEGPVVALTHRLDPAGDAILRDHYSRPQTNPLMSALRRMAVLSPVERAAILSDRAYLASGLYGEVFRPQGLRHAVLSCLRRDNGVLAVCGLLCRNDVELDAAQAQLFRQMLPHLRGALEITAKLAQLDRSLASARIAADAGDAGLIFVDARGVVLFCNTAGEAVLSRGDGLRQRDRVLSTAQAGDEKRLALLIDAAARRLPPGGGGLRLQRASGLPPLGVIVLPAPAGSSEQGEGCALVVIVDFAAARTPPARWLAEIFGLTRAEAEVALAILEGKRPEDIAEERGARLATVRSQIQAVFAKTETRSQAGLVRLLGRVPAVTGAARQL